MPPSILYTRNPYAGGFTILMTFNANDAVLLTFEVDRGGPESMRFFEAMGYERQKILDTDGMNRILEFKYNGPLPTVKDWLQAHGSA